MHADWQDTATAIGTVAVAGVALFAEWRADIRVKREREHSAKVLAEERAAADTRLMRRMPSPSPRRSRSLLRWPAAPAGSPKSPESTWYRIWTAVVIPGCGCFTAAPGMTARWMLPPSTALVTAAATSGGGHGG